MTEFDLNNRTWDQFLKLIGPLEEETGYTVKGPIIFNPDNCKVKLNIDNDEFLYKLREKLK